MPYVASDGVKIAFEDTGSGPPVVLVHGFATSADDNWGEPGWIDLLGESGRRVVALDCRGHGESDKPHDPSMYGVDAMAADVVGLLDHLAIERAELMGYSMGGRISLGLLTRHGDRFSAAVLGGIGRTATRPRKGAGAIAAVLEADDVPKDAPPEARAFRAFAEQQGNDLRALAACMRGLRSSEITDDELRSITTPVLIVTGSDDALVGDPGELAELIPRARVEVVPGRDHLTVVPDDRYKRVALAFLDEHQRS